MEAASWLPKDVAMEGGKVCISSASTWYVPSCSTESSVQRLRSFISTPAIRQVPRTSVGNKLHVPEACCIGTASSTGRIHSGTVNKRNPLLSRSHAAPFNCLLPRPSPDLGIVLSSVSKRAGVRLRHSCPVSQSFLLTTKTVTAWCGHIIHTLLLKPLFLPAVVAGSARRIETRFILKRKRKRKRTNSPRVWTGHPAALQSCPRHSFKPTQQT